MFDLLQEIRRSDNEDAMDAWREGQFFKAAAILADAEQAGNNRRAVLQEAARKDESIIDRLSRRLRATSLWGDRFERIVRACHAYVGGKILAPLKPAEAASLDAMAECDDYDYYLVAFSGHAVCLADASIDSETKAMALAEALGVPFDDWRPRNKD